MQFHCDNCKAALQIADEKVKGKRLIVRCSRCGVKLQIADPALSSARPPAPASAASSAVTPLATQRAAAAAANPAPSAAAVTPAKPAAAPSQIESQIGAPANAPTKTSAPASKAPAASASMAFATPNRTATSTATPIPTSTPIPNATPTSTATATANATSTPTEDIERTQSMDTAVLEAALRASKGIDSSGPGQSLGGAPAAAPAQAAPATDPLGAAQTAEANSSEIWFALVNGKQIGPLSWDELGERIERGEIGARTYLWRDGMAAWARAQEVDEVASLFAAGGQGRDAGQEPSTSASEQAIPNPFAPPEETTAAASGAVSSTTSDGADPVELARWASAELDRKRDENPAAQAAQGSGAQAGAPRASVAVPGSSLMTKKKGNALKKGFFAALAVAAGAAGIWAVLWHPSDAVSKAQAEAAASFASSAPPAGAADRAPLQKAPLSFETVSQKLAENKGALQACVDEALRREPELRVETIHVATTVAPSGAVASARIDQSAVDGSQLGACLKQAAQRISFPPFSGEAFDLDIPVVVQSAK